MENEYSLYHFGVKGMRWGHRKGRSDSTSSKGKSKTPEQKAETKKRVKKVLTTAALVALGAKIANDIVINRLGGEDIALTTVSLSQIARETNKIKDVNRYNRYINGLTNMQRYVAKGYMHREILSDAISSTGAKIANFMFGK